jgi:bacterioferritin
MNRYYDYDNSSTFFVDMPYPQVTIREKNTAYAILLSGTFAGPGSESTAIAQYTAHNFYTMGYPEIANAYRNIISVEVHHLNLLGNMIRDLGVHPRFMTYETGAYWSGNYPAYACDIKRILNLDIQGEMDAAEHYKRLIRQIEHQDIQNLLQRIVLDEEKHIQILTSFLTNYVR